MSQYSIQTMVDPARNFGKVTVSAGYGSIDMVIVLNTGDGARLPQPSMNGEFNLTWWNSTDFLDPSDDPNREIVRATTRTEDILTVARAQEGTSASNKNLPGKTYKMILAVTAKIIPDLQTDAQTRADTTVEVHRLTGIHTLPQPSDNLGAMQRTLLQAIASTVQKLILSQKAAMDEATYSNILKSGNNYIIDRLGYTQNFDAFGDGNLAGQDSWTLVGNSNALVGADYKYGATGKGVYIRAVRYSGAGDCTLSRVISNTPIANQICYIRQNYNPDNTGVPIIVYFREGGIDKLAIAMDIGGYLGAANSMRYLDSANGWQTVQAISNNTYYKVEIRYNGTTDTQTIYVDDVLKINNVATKAFTNIDEIRLVGSANPNNDGANGWIDSFSETYNTSITGSIKSNAIAKDANIGLRYWGDVVANLIAGAAGSTIKIKILNSAGTALHTNFVTVAANEYARIPLERAVVLTATSAGQTVWNFASLSNADTLINELGVLAKALLVELTTDGTNYSKLDEISGTPASGQFNEDISNPKAPKITTNGTGVVSGTSKLRATYIVNIPLSNTTIKLQIQLNRLAAEDTSPSIQPFVGDATKHVGAGQVAIV